MTETRTRAATRAATWIRPAAVASLVVNILIVVTGGVVRLTGSGLGCPTWPRCTDESFVPHRALGIHGAIEFGNRMVTFLLAAVAIATFVVAWRYGRPVPVARLAFVLALGCPGAGADRRRHGAHRPEPLDRRLPPAGVAGDDRRRRRAAAAHRRGRRARRCPLVPDGITWLVRATSWPGWAVLYVGTVVTGSGPHAGDLDAPRNNLDPRALSQLHTDFVFLLLGLTVAAVLVLRSADAPERARRAAVVLLAVELGQGLVGFVQYFTDLPVGLVTLHLLGAALTSAALTWLLVSVRERPEVPQPL